MDELFEVGEEGHLTGRIKFEVFHSVGGGRDSVASFGGLYAAYAPETAVAAARRGSQLLRALARDAPSWPLPKAW